MCSGKAFYFIRNFYTSEDILENFSNMEIVQIKINAALFSALLVLVKWTQCNNIYSDLDVVQYCADQRSLCQDTGSFIHIVCEYYGKSGSSCSKFTTVPLDESNENALLFRINTIRLKAANGRATGKGQQKLPRAYGMKKVFWDGELAAFAKIMINQCTSKHRYSCAASKTFRNPMMVYSFANTTSSVAQIIENVLSSWEADAQRTTPDEILQSPDLKGGEPHYYIKMLVGDVTHIGCAAGVYEHEIRPIAIKARDNIRLSGHIICYLSHYSLEGTPVYNTTEPIRGTGWTRCGCPPGYRETKNCLCVPSPYTEHSLIRQATAVAVQTKNTITTSTQAYYDDLEKDLQQIDDLVSPGAKMKHLGPGRHQYRARPDSSQEKLEWAPQISLSHQMQDMLEPKIQQKLKETQLPSKGVGDCEPKIIMLPILTIQNAPKYIGLRSRGNYRRSDNSSSVTKTKAIDDISLLNASIAMQPATMSIRTKLLETMTKIKNKQAADIFSNEKADHGQEFIQTTLSVELTKQTAKPAPSTQKRSQDEHSENSKHTVLNILELLEEEEGKFVEPVQRIAEPSKASSEKSVMMATKRLRRE